jgi:predicted nucleic acid-binding protein
VIVYFDTSALIPLLVAEPTSAGCRRLWEDADAIASTRLLYVEAGTALAQARRLDRLDAEQHRRCLELLDQLWPQFNVVELDAALCSSAARLAHDHALRGYDAVHCAAALDLVGEDLVAATGDQQLLAAWHAEGLATFDTRQPSPPAEAAPRRDGSP